MKKFKYLVPWLLAIILIVSAVGSYILGQRSRSAEIEGLKVQLTHDQIAPSIERDTIRDTVPVTTATAIPLRRKEFADVADRRLIKDLRLRLKQVESQQRQGTLVHDTVKLVENNPGSFCYDDHWASFRLDMKPPDTTLTYSVRDSVTTIVYREYKHKFLWFRWGTKGYKVKIINFNPHAKVLYNQFVSVEK